MIPRKILLTLLILLITFPLQSCKKDQHYQTTGYIEGNLFYLMSPYSGYLKELYVQEGQNLKKDQAILKIQGQKSLNSPMVSIVNEIYYLKDEFVPSGYPIVSLFMPNQMKIIFYVSEKDLDKIKLNKQIFILIKNEKYPIKINFISNQAEYIPEAVFSEKNRDKLVYKIKADVTSSLEEKLKIGQPVDIDYE